MKTQPAAVNRRTAVKSIGAAAAFSAFPHLSFGKAKKRPNIIIIMADDMGYSDLACYGAEISTPNIDSMAYNGVRFTQFYNCARCCPTRASLLTGLYPHQAGVGHMVNQRKHPSYQGYLNNRCLTIAEVLRAGGYHTLMSGKWHVGEERPHWPRDRGFEQFYGLVSGATNFFKIDEGRVFAENDRRISDVGEDFYITDAFTDHAVRQINSVAGSEKPFFLYLPYTAPHWPLHAHPSDIRKYTGKYDSGWDELRRTRHKRQVELGVVDPLWDVTERDNNAPAWDDAEHKEWEAMRMAVYAAQIECMDRNIGRVLQTLRDNGEEENTLILFLMDNGGCAEGRPGNDPAIMPGPVETFQSYGLPWANASNTPFRRYKHWTHEGGISTPLVAYWKEGIPKPGSITDQAGHLIDLLPTCLDLANVEYPDRFDGRDVTPLEGKSLLPILEGRRRKAHDAIFWEHEGNRAVRSGDWKIVSQRPNYWELYNMQNDRTETKNLAMQEPQRLQRMTALYEQWADRCSVLPWDEVQKLEQA